MKKISRNLQVVTRRFANILKEIDVFGKATESSIFRVAAIEFGKSVVAHKFSRWVYHKSVCESRQLIDGRSSNRNC